MALAERAGKSAVDNATEGAGDVAVDTEYHVHK
jgi:hypothetical protein